MKTSLRFVALTAALVDVPAVEPVAWRWKFDPDADWHYGGKEPKGFRFGDPEIVETLYPAPPLSREGEDSAEVLRSALQRISELTPARANARDARDLHLTVKAIAEVALAATRSASATSAKTWGEWEREKPSEEDQ